MIFYEYGEIELPDKIVPYSISGITQKDGKPVQELDFTIPEYYKGEFSPKTLMEYFFGKKVVVKLMVNYRPSRQYILNVLSPGWKALMASTSFFFTILFIMSISLSFGIVDFFKKLGIDRKTNMYSLVNLQALWWSLVLIGSYFYVALSKAGIMRDGILPDFNLSLVGLMGISYGGMVGNLYLDQKSEVVIKKEGDPSWKDLFCSAEGDILLPKVQLLGFTILSIIIYLVYLFQGNILNGLPDIPASLHTLLITSQGGYLGGCD